MKETNEIKSRSLEKSSARRFFATPRWEIQKSLDGGDGKCRPCSSDMVRHDHEWSGGRLTPDRTIDQKGGRTPVRGGPMGGTPGSGGRNPLPGGVGPPPGGGPFFDR